MWCIGEVDQAYQREDAELRFGSTDSPDFRAYSPCGTIPVVFDGGSDPLWEPSAIMRYLAGRYGRPPFWPEEGLKRAAVDKWAEWGRGQVAQMFTGPIFGHLIRTPPSQHRPVALARAMTAFNRLLDIADLQFAKNTYLTGNDFTLADIQFGHILYRYFELPIERLNRPGLKRYYDLLTERPAFREHVMVSYEELRARD
jgi:glutathione S-transferase